MVEKDGPTLLVVWHSLTGATDCLVGALCEGARAQAGDAVRVWPVHASRATVTDVLGCDALVLATPETLGSISGQMKDFLDRSYYALLDQRPGLPVALLVSAGSDGRPTVMQLQRIVAGQRWRLVAEPLRLVNGAQTAAAIRSRKEPAQADVLAARDLGALLAAGVQQHLF